MRESTRSSVAHVVPSAQRLLRKPVAAPWEVARGPSIPREVSYDNHFDLVFSAGSNRVENDDLRRRRVDRHLSRIRAGDKNLPAKEGGESWGSTLTTDLARVRRDAR